MAPPPGALPVRLGHLYDGRLEPAEVWARRSISGGAGSRFVEVEHAANRRAAPEAAEWIAKEVERLRRFSFTEADGSSRRLRFEDVLVAGPELLVAEARTLEQMRLVNTVCRFAEAAS
jgi:hypothetical protein